LKNSTLIKGDIAGFSDHQVFPPKTETNWGASGKSSHCSCITWKHGPRSTGHLVRWRPNEKPELHVLNRTLYNSTNKCVLITFTN